MKHHLLLLPLAAGGSLLALAGCAHIGPRTVAVDRFDYSTAIADSWKQQTLLNIVKLRYMDLPVFVDVSSVVSGYSLQTGVNVDGTLSSERAVQGNFAMAGAQAIYTDRPTITYTPMTGEKFLRGLITPIDPKNIFFMLQSGYPADFILGLTVESINGVRNRSTRVARCGRPIRSSSARWACCVKCRLPARSAMRVEEDKASGQTAVVLFRRDDVPADIVEKTAEIRRLFKLPPDLQKYSLIYSPVRGADNELAVNSRSMLQIMAAFASYLDVPEAHLKDHSALPAFENAPAETRRQKVRIHSGKDKPANAFTAVRYRDYWFWIDDGDWQAKRALTAVMFFFTMANTGGTEPLPLITIPAQ